MTANPNNIWDQLKEQLIVRFSDVADAQKALSLLRQTRQKAGESVHVYAEKNLSLADAYDNQEGAAVENQLIDIFVDGLVNDQLKMKILRDQTDTLQGAVGVAVNEQNLRKRVEMPHGSHQSTSSHTPMEVDHSRGHRFRPKFNRFKKINSTENTQ